MKIKEIIKDFIKKIKDFSLLRTLLDRKLRCLTATIKFKKEVIIYHQTKLTEADELKTSSLREISKLADEIKEIQKQMDDTLRVRCP